MEIKNAENLSRNNLDLIIDLFPESIVITDLKGNITDCNDKAVNLSGFYSKNELIGLNILNLAAPEDQKKVKDDIQKLLFKGLLQNREYKAINRDNKSIPIEISANVISNDSCEPYAFLCIIKDITKRKKTENELKKSKNKLETIIQGSPVLTFIIDKNHKVLYWNKAIEEYSGLTAEETIGTQNHWKAFYGEKRPLLADLMLESDFEGISKWYSENYSRSKIIDGAYETEGFFPIMGILPDMGKKGIWLRGTASIIKDEGGKIIGAMEILEDITEHKKAEEQIKKAFIYNRGLIEASLDPLVTIGPDGKITDVNSSTEDVTGYSRKQLIGTDFSDYFTEPEKAREGYQRVFEDGIVRDYKLEIEHRKGYITPVSYNASVYKDENGEVIGVFAAARDITEQKIAEKALKAAYDNLEIKVKERTKELEEAHESLSESEEKFRELFNKANDVITLGELTEDGKPGKFIEVNDAASWKLGYSKDELLNMTPLDLIQKRIDNVPQNAPKLLDKGTTTFEAVHIAKDGSRIPVEINTHLFNLKGKDVILGISRDISERKKAQEAIIKSRNFLDKIINSIADPVFVKDERHQWVLLNDAYCDFMGYSRQELLGKSDYEFFPKNEADVFWEKDEEVFNTSMENINEEEFTDSNKILHTIITKKSLYTDISGEKYIVGIIRDITELKKAEKEIKYHSRRLDILNKIIVAANRSNSVESLLKNVLDLTLELMNFDSGGIYLIDENTKTAEIVHYKGLTEDFVETINNIQIDEYPFNEVFINGKSMFMNQYDDSSPEFYKYHLKSGASVPIYSKNKIKGAFNLANKEKHNFTDEEKKLINSIGREVGNTLTKLITEKNLTGIVEELKRSNEELEQFAYITSHDLQEPLRTIVSFTQLLEMRYKGKFDSDADEFMGYMVNASLRMKEMIQGLLDYSRIGREEINFTTINLKDILKNALFKLKPIIEENNAVITCDKLPSVTGDSKLLIQLFENLISNSIKFKGERDPEIHISSTKSSKKNEYIISIEDNGIGIDLQYADRIFKVFKRLHTLSEYKGAGIGLAICRRIVEIHGGNIWVESELNEGSKFYFTLQI